MPQIFSRHANWVARTALVALPALVLLSIAVAEGLDRSDSVTGKNQFLEQPVPFSHVHHVGDLGMDCRYCHAQVERGAVAQIPPSEVCMTCHSNIWKNSPTLAPVRESAASGQPLHWARVTRLPDFVYFNHAIHVDKGVACVTCHGRVDEMPLTRLKHPMQMQFCIDCHEHPERNLVPREMVQRPDAEPELELSLGLAHANHVHSKLDCVTCHR